MIGLFLIPSLCFAGIHDDVCRSKKTSYPDRPIGSNMSDGPFGANMGDSPEKYCEYTNKPVNYYNNIYTIHAESMPKPHSIFKDYRLYFFEWKGLFKIEARSDTLSSIISDNDSSDPIKIYNKLKTQLQNKYGKSTDGKRYDNIISIWENVNSADIAKIELELYVYGSFSTHSYSISLTYTFKNKIESDTLREKADADAL